MIILEVTDKDGGWIRTEEYETVGDLLKEWPHALPVSGSALEWSVWIGSNP